MNVPRGRRRSTLLVAVLACAALVAACGGEDAGGPAQGDGADSTTTAGAEQGADTTTTTEPRGPLGSGEPVTLAFAGDASFEGLIGSLQSDPELAPRPLLPGEGCVVPGGMGGAVPVPVPPALPAAPPVDMR